MSTQYDKPIVDIARYVFHYEIDDANHQVWDRARTALLDALGCAIETSATSVECRALLEPVASGTIVPDGFRVPGTNLQAGPVEGAFDLGVLIRYLDHNDALGGAEWGHPSGRKFVTRQDLAVYADLQTADNIAAILAVMDWLSRTSQSGRYIHTGPPLTLRTLLVALIKAYEIQGCYQMGNAFNVYGIDHVVLVKLASAAVVSWLLGLTEEQTMASISHVWMDGQPNRVYRSRDSTIPRKGWAAGDAARRAVQLALYVRAGQPGAPKALSARPWGFWAHTFGEKGFEFPKAFGIWTIQNVLFKIMPVEGHAISAVEAALLQLPHLKAAGLSNLVKEIDQIDLRTTAAADLIINKSGPLHNAADRDHCIQYVVALTLLKGSAPKAADYLKDSPWIASEDLNDLRGRIHVTSDPQLTRDYLDLEKKSIGTGLTVHLKNGTIIPEVMVEYPIGHVRNPRTNAELSDKFLRNFAHMFSEVETGKIVEAANDNDLSVSDFVDLLVRPGIRSNI